MSAHTWERELYESGLWLADISRAAWWEMRRRHRFQDAGLDLEEAEIARLVHEQRRDLARGSRVVRQVLGGNPTLTLDALLPRQDRTLGELVGIA